MARFVKPPSQLLLHDDDDDDVGDDHDDDDDDVLGFLLVFSREICRLVPPRPELATLWREHRRRSSRPANKKTCHPKMYKLARRIVPGGPVFS